jgi:hypothetical protein
MRALASLSLLAERARFRNALSLIILCGATAMVAGPTLAAAGEEAVIQISAVLATKRTP